MRHRVCYPEDKKMGKGGLCVPASHQYVAFIWVCRRASFHPFLPLIPPYYFFRVVNAKWPR